MILKFIKKTFKFCRNLLTGFFWYGKDLFQYYAAVKKNGLREKFYLFPKLFDRDPSSHTFDKHYVYMDRWAFSHLLSAKPLEHIDVGSSVRFLSMATLVCPVKFVDIRTVKLGFNNFECIQGDILRLPFRDNSVKSLSCLHVAEHIGLGRYGDSLDVHGTLRACRELKRVLSPGGFLYFALPVGRPAVYFNAHRIHNPKEILEYFQGLKLLEFAAVNDRSDFIIKARLEDFEEAYYACGMYLFTKT